MPNNGSAMRFIRSSRVVRPIATPTGPYHQILPRVAQNLSGQEVTKLLRTCTPEAWDEFWAKRFKTLQKKQAEVDGRIPIRYCAIDSTSINSYSSAEQIEYGHAKQDEGLPQLNLATVLDQQTGHIVYAFAYNGSINDRGSYSYIYERMKQGRLPDGSNHADQRSRVPVKLNAEQADQ